MAITVLFQMNIWHCKGLNIVCTAVQKVEVTDFVCLFLKKPLIKHTVKLQ